MVGDTSKEPQRKNAMRSCKLCGTTLSPYSPFCVKCGHPQGKPLALWLCALFLVLLLGFYALLVFLCRGALAFT